MLTKTEGLTDVIGSENPVFRSVFSHIAPWIVGTEFVQENSTERMSQLSLNYRDSPLSASHHFSGSLRAGDRVPNLDVRVIGGHTLGVRYVHSTRDAKYGTLPDARFAEGTVTVVYSFLGANHFGAVTW